jgi:hypothetical protein
MLALVLGAQDLLDCLEILLNELESDYVVRYLFLVGTLVGANLYERGDLLGE